MPISLACLNFSSVGGAAWLCGFFGLGVVLGFFVLFLFFLNVEVILIGKSV